RIRHVGAITDHGVGRLAEKHRLFQIHRTAHFGSMIGIIAADAEYAAYGITLVAADDGQAGNGGRAGDPGHPPSVANRSAMRRSEPGDSCHRRWLMPHPDHAAVDRSILHASHTGQTGRGVRVDNAELLKELRIDRNQREAHDSGPGRWPWIA